MLWTLCGLSGSLTLVPSCFGNTAHVNKETCCPVLTSSPLGGSDARAVMKQYHVLVNFALALGHQPSSVRLGQLPFYLRGQMCIFGTDPRQDSVREEEVHLKIVKFPY